MQISSKINVTLLILGTLLIFSSAFINLNEKSNINTAPKNDESPSNTPDAKPLSSGCWTVSFIHVYNNWSAPCPYIQPHAGTLADPHIIENVTIDATNSPTSMGILIADSADPDEHFIIRNCTILNAAYGCGGIYLAFTTHGKIENNICTLNNGFGIFLFESSNNTIFDNDIIDNAQSGIYIKENSANNTIINNTISNNCYEPMGWYAGIHLDTSGKNNTISGNIIENNEGDGIWLNDADYTKIYKNTISNNDYGVWLLDSSHNEVVNNTFVSNNECIVEDGICIDNILTPNTCIPKTASSSDDDDGDGNGAPKISGYDLIIISLTIIIISGALSFVLLKKRTKCPKF